MKSWKPSAKFGPVLSSRETFHPGKQFEVQTKKEKFASLNKWVTDRSGWIVSIPGAAEVTVECLEGSPIPAELASLGYRLEPVGQGERILVGSVVERLSLSSSGAFEIMTEGSTKAVAQVRRHEGIAKVERFTFRLPD